MGRNQSVVLLNTLVLTAAMAAPALTQANPVVIRNAGGVPACVVTRGTDDKGQTVLLVDVREPAEPAAELLQRLPPDRHDFSTLPIRVFVIPPAGAGAPRPIFPQSLEGVLRAVTIDGAASEGRYVRATFLPAQIGATAEIVGERMVPAPSGERVTTQTRCRVSKEDAALWNVKLF